MKKNLKTRIIKVLVIGIFLTLILAMVVIEIPKTTKAVTTYYVGKPGDGADYTCIQTAISNEG